MRQGPPRAAAAHHLTHLTHLPLSLPAGDSLPAITLPTMAEIQSFMASPEIKQVQSWIAEAPPLPKPSKPVPPPKREPKAAKPAPHRPPHRGEAAAAPQAAVDAAPPADIAQPVAEVKP
jgi:hypothetical protein